MTNMKYILTFGIIAVSLAVSIFAIQQQSYATGCPTNFVSEHIKNAKTALESGNTEEVKNQLELAEEAIGMASQESE